MSHIYTSYHPYVTGVTCIICVTSCLFQHESVLILRSAYKILLILLNFTTTMYISFIIISLTSTVLFDVFDVCCFPILLHRNFMYLKILRNVIFNNSKSGRVTDPIRLLFPQYCSYSHPPHPFNLLHHRSRSSGRH